MTLSFPDQSKLKKLISEDIAIKSEEMSIITETRKFVAGRKIVDKLTVKRSLQTDMVKMLINSKLIKGQSG